MAKSLTIGFCAILFILIISMSSHLFEDLSLPAKSSKSLFQPPLFMHTDLVSRDQLSSNDKINKSFLLSEEREKIKQETRVHFSRFSNWDLLSIIENQQIVRESNPNTKFSYFSNTLQQLEQEKDINLIQTVTPSSTIGLLGMKDSEQLSSQQWPISTKQNKSYNKTKISGLRKLSGKAYLVVKELNSATYKKVATRLIKQIFEDPEQLIDSKEQSNIKRRVYDALNVLIALGILKKEGKSISYRNQPEKPINISFPERKNLLQKKMQEITKQIMTKKQKKRQLNNRLKALNLLINRNKTSKIHTQIYENLKIHLDANDKKEVVSFSSQFYFVEVSANRQRSGSYIQTTPEYVLKLSEDKTFFRAVFPSTQSTISILNGFEAISRFFFDKHKSG